MEAGHFALKSLMKRVLVFNRLVIFAGIVLGHAGITISAAAQPRSGALAALTVSSMPSPAEPSQAPGAMSVEARETFVNEHCAYCHDESLRTGGFSFEDVDLAHPDQNAEQIEKVILKLRTGMMPPAGAPRPNPDTVNAFTLALEAEIDRVAAADPNPGTPYLHRLNRTEYANAILDLLALEIDSESLLPADTRSQGFDNISEVLSVSPTLMEAYVRAAGKIGRLAVGDPGMSPIEETYRIGTNFSQIRHVEGTPFGTRGGIVRTHNFPADGEYIFRMLLVFTRNTFLFGSTMYAEQLEVAVNGERVALFDIDPLMTAGENDLRTPPIKVKAGPQTISASFVNLADGPIEDPIWRPERSLADDFSGQVEGLTNPPHLRDLTIMGPFNATGVSESPSRRKIFTCLPANASEEGPCATEIITTLARQAFRRPLTAENVEELMSAYQEGADQGDFDTGIRMALQFIIANPEFVFRVERTPVDAVPGDNYRISDPELASRLAFFLWSTIPDDELNTLAGQGQLKDPTVLEQQVRRMLADPRSEALAKNFAGQWLHLRNLEQLLPDVYLFADADQNLFESMRRETELLFDTVVRENRNIVDLLTADYTFVNERLAKHYEIPNILGNRFRRVTIQDENRFGLLGQGSILSVTSFSNRTSPVVRGKWILEQVLGVTAPIPPPNVPLLEENNLGKGGKPLRLRSVRERMEQHRAVEPCASCHKIMDPMGLALENFDAVGAWRAYDGGFPVDPSGELVDGTKVTSPADLRRALLKYSDAYVRNFIVKLVTYALGREFTYVDMPVVREIERQAARNDNRFTSIVLGIVNSMPFQMRKLEQPSETRMAAPLPQ